MADTYTISAAARLCYCDRRTLQRAIHAGRLHLDAKHCLSREELLTAGYLIADTPQPLSQGTPQERPQAASQAASQGTPLLAALERLALAVEGVRQELQYLREHPHTPPPETPQAAPQVPPRRRRRRVVSRPQAAPQPVPQALPYDPRKFVLGKLCPRRHEFCNMGMSLLRLPSRNCPTCVNIHKRQRRAAR
jgi:hypothetical protein